MNFYKNINFFLLPLMVSYALFSCSKENNKNILPDDYISTINIDSIKIVKGNKFYELRSIINKHDPIGLIVIGSPEDEYDPEVTTIITKLESNLTEKEVHDLVFNEFLFWFGDESTTGPKNSYKPLAKDIYVWIQKID